MAAANYPLGKVYCFLCKRDVSLIEIKKHVTIDHKCNQGAIPSFTKAKNLSDLLNKFHEKHNKNNKICPFCMKRPAGELDNHIATAHGISDFFKNTRSKETARKVIKNKNKRCKNPPDTSDEENRSIEIPTKKPRIANKNGKCLPYKQIKHSAPVPQQIIEPTTSAPEKVTNSSTSSSLKPYVVYKKTRSLIGKNHGRRAIPSSCRNIGGGESVKVKKVGAVDNMFSKSSTRSILRSSIPVHNITPAPIKFEPVTPTLTRDEQGSSTPVESLFPLPQENKEQESFTDSEKLVIDEKAQNTIKKKMNSNQKPTKLNSPPRFYSF